MFYVAKKGVVSCILHDAYWPMLYPPQYQNLNLHIVHVSSTMRKGQALG